MKSKVLFILISAIIYSSCIREAVIKKENSDHLYIDSVVFRHYKKQRKPYLLSSTTYIYSDSMCRVLDTLSLNKLVAMNSTDRSYNNPLIHQQYADTLMVDIIYTRGLAAYSFGDIRCSGDSIFLRLAGETYRKYASESVRLSVAERYYRSSFKILADSTRNYLIYFRYDDFGY